MSTKICSIYICTNKVVTISIGYLKIILDKQYKLDYISVLEHGTNLANKRIWQIYYNYNISKGT